MDKLLSKYDLKLLASKGEQKEVIEKLLAIAPTQSNEVCNLILTLSATYKNFNHKMASGVLSDESQGLLNNEITMRLLMIIDGVDFHVFEEAEESKIEAEKRENLEKEFLEQQEKLTLALQQEREEKEELLFKIQDFENRQKTIAAENSELLAQKSKAQIAALEKERQEKQLLERRLKELEDRNEERRRLEELDKLGQAIKVQQITPAPIQEMEEKEEEKSSTTPLIIGILIGLLMVVLAVFAWPAQEVTPLESHWEGEWEHTIFLEKTRKKESDGTIILKKENGRLKGTATVQLKKSTTPDRLVFRDIEIIDNGKKIAGQWHFVEAETVKGRFEFTLGADKKSFKGFQLRKFGDNPAARFGWKGRKTD